MTDSALYTKSKNAEVSDKERLPTHKKRENEQKMNIFERYRAPSPKCPDRGVCCDCPVVGDEECEFAIWIESEEDERAYDKMWEEYIEKKKESMNKCDSCPESKVIITEYPAQAIRDENSETCKSCSRKEESE